MLPLIVTAHLDTPAIGLLNHPIMLDGPLSWAVAMRARQQGADLPEITPECAPDLDLPLQRWERAGTWGWCTSQAAMDIRAYGTLELRRTPATHAMARYARDRKHHIALGPYKARDTALETAWIPMITWHAVADSDGLDELLPLITHIGQHASRGHGHISKWTMAEDHLAEAWQDRPMPAPGVPRRAYRAPYHHQSRQYEC